MLILEEKRIVKSFKNLETVTLAVYLLGGDNSYIDTEDIAVKANELAPGRFSWLKYPDQINIEKVRTSLSDAKKPKNGGYLIGVHTQGWLLTRKGFLFCRKKLKELDNQNTSQMLSANQDSFWLTREKTRMLSTVAFEKFISQGEDTITPREAEAFFRLDEYVVGQARKKKISRVVTAFKDDSDLGPIVKKLAEKVEKND